MRGRTLLLLILALAALPEAEGQNHRAGAGNNAGETRTDPSGSPQRRFAVIGLPERSAESINRSGEVLCTTDDTWLLWSQGTVVRSGSGELAMKLNDQSQILFDDPPRVLSSNGVTELRNFHYQSSTSGSGAPLESADINNSGSVIGYFSGPFAGDPGDAEVPGLWLSPSSEPIPLSAMKEYNANESIPGLLENDLPPGSGISADRINDAGVIVGSKFVGGNVSCTIWYGPGSKQTVSNNLVFITGLNEYNQVIGRATAQDSGIVWEAGNTTVFGPAAYPNAISSPSSLAAVQIVGRQWSSDVFRARLWQKSFDDSGNLLDWTGYDLNNLIPANSGWILDAAYGVNNSGLIVGGGTYADPAVPGAQAQDRAFLLLPLDMKVVDRDDPKRKWADAKDAGGKPIYAGTSCGDMVSWKLGGTDSWSTTTFTWTAEGPGGETITGPTGAGKNEWKIADGDDDDVNDWLKWKPGKWKIKVQIGSSTAEFDQEVGIRTEQYFAVGTIPAEAESTTGVEPRIVDQWSCPNITGAMWAASGGGINSASSALYIPMNEANRVYVNHRLLNATRNFDPEPAVKADKGLIEGCGLDPYKHYRWFAGCQFRFRVNGNNLAAAPEMVPGNRADIVGFTPAPCSQSNFTGIIGEKHADSGKTSGTAGAAEFSLLTKNRAGRHGQAGWANLNGRMLPWVFFRFRFEAKDGLIDSRFSDGGSSDPNGPDAKDYSMVPTILVYRRYYDLRDSQWKVELVQKFDEQRRPFFSIGTQIPAAPFVMP